MGANIEICRCSAANWALLSWSIKYDFWHLEVLKNIYFLKRETNSLHVMQSMMHRIGRSNIHMISLNIKSAQMLKAIIFFMHCH